MNIVILYESDIAIVCFPPGFRGGIQGGNKLLENFVEGGKNFSISRGGILQGRKPNF